MRKFEDITRDIAAELTASAERVYNVGISIQTAILAMALVGAVFAAFGEESFLLFLVVGGSAVVEYLIGCGIIYSVAVHRYAEGHKLRLLERMEENAQPAPETKAQEEKAPAASRVRPAAAVSSVSPIGRVVAQNNAKNAPLPDGWTCACGKNHPPFVSTCSCGRSKHDQ